MLEEIITGISDKEKELRTKRSLELQAFDIYKTNVSYDVIVETSEEHNEIVTWYQSILDLNEEAINNVPEQIARFM